MSDNDIITFADEEQDKKIIEVCKSELITCTSPEERQQLINSVYSFLRYRKFENSRILNLLRQAGFLEEELNLVEYSPEHIALLRTAFPETFVALRDLTTYRETDFEDIQLRILSDLQGWYNGDKIYFVFADGNKITEVKSPNLKEYLKLKYGLVLDNDFRNLLEEKAREKGEISTIQRHRVGITELNKYKLVLNTGQQAFVYDRLTQEFFEVKKSVYEQHYIERSEKLGVDVDLIVQLMKQSLTEFMSALRTKVFFLHDFVRQWTFESEKTSLLYTAFVAMLPSHTLWSWRPFLHVVGLPGAGKTLLFELTLFNLYDGLILRADNVTPYALPQELQDTGKIPVFDNFDIQNHKHAEMFNMLESSSRKWTQILRGTTGQEAKKLRLKHLPIFNSTTTIGFNSATAQRTVRLRLISKPKNVIHELSTSQYVELASYFIAANLRLLDLLEDIIRQEQITERVKENIQYAFALLKLLGIVRSINEFAPVTDYEIPNDGEELLATILNANIRYEAKPYAIDSMLVSIFENLSSSEEETFYAEILNTAGIYIDKRQELVGFNFNKILHEILRYTRFRSINLYTFNELLRGLEGKASQKIYYNGTEKRVTTVPYSVIRRVLGLDNGLDSQRASK